ncbi:hypothetical protein [Halanaerobacter jeridensis]|uniref:Uncharacterized protein n=1 Tax=Halanaerobacter jeridensis TaxID=706427 RepID=A0A939BQ06_9FIRM|nr:hypothetical protein [Halanaerobacter jeridensis]MBM7555789.1 hypothetical protein [Halanaerobacter jeridensis]
MEKYFKLYSSEIPPKSLSHNIFSIIGYKEPALTKGLSFLIYKSKKFCNGFLKLINKKLKERGLNKIGQVEILKVLSEQYPNFSKQKIRRDITLKLNPEKMNNSLIVIEAKNPKLSLKNLSKVEDQLLEYLSEDHYSDVSNFNRKIGIFLTNIEEIYRKRRDIDLISITWKEIFNLLERYKEKDEYINMFYKHLLEGEMMQFFKKEIFSPPAGKTIDKIRELNIYCCQYDRTIKKSLYLMPRIPLTKSKKDSDFFNTDVAVGVFEELYPIIDTFAVDKNTVNEIENKEIKEKVEKWYEDEEFKSGQVFILGDKLPFDTPKRTKKQNNSYQTYYSFDEIWSKIVKRDK